MELPKFRAWFENKKVMSEVKKINFWSEEIDTVAFEGKFLDDGDIKYTCMLSIRTVSLWL